MILGTFLGLSLALIGIASWIAWGPEVRRWDQAGGRFVTIRTARAVLVIKVR